MSKLIKRNNGMIVACDFNTLDELGNVIESVEGIEDIVGLKIGFQLGWYNRVPEVVDYIRDKNENLVIISDPQKAGNDTFHMVSRVVDANLDAKVDALIIFPLAGGPDVEMAYIAQCQENNLPLMVGARLTEKCFFTDEGGFIPRESVDSVFKIAAETGVEHFVLPGNRPKELKHYVDLIDKKKATYYLPGFGKGYQGGDFLTVHGALCDKTWHPIVGRSIYEAKDIRKAANDLVKNMT